jgi:hypothetical protein
VATLETLDFSGRPEKLENEIGYNLFGNSSILTEWQKCLCATPEMKKRFRATAETIGKSLLFTWEKY